MSEVYIERELFVCSCGDTEHQFIVQDFKGEDGLYFSVHLVRPDFFRRLWYALKYIFGRPCKYGHFDEVVLFKNEIERLRNVLDRKLGEVREIDGKGEPDEH